MKCVYLNNVATQGPATKIFPFWLNSQKNSRAIGLNWIFTQLVNRAKYFVSSICHNSLLSQHSAAAPSASSPCRAGHRAGKRTFLEAPAEKGWSKKSSTAWKTCRQYFFFVFAYFGICCVFKVSVRSTITVGGKMKWLYARRPVYQYFWWNHDFRTGSAIWLRIVSFCFRFGSRSWEKSSHFQWLALEIKVNTWRAWEKNRSLTQQYCTSLFIFLSEKYPAY